MCSASLVKSVVADGSRPARPRHDASPVRIPDAGLLGITHKGTMQSLRRASRVCVVGIVVCLNAVSILAQSEAVVRGQVTAAANGSALAGSTVSLAAASTEVRLHTTADSSGRFAFQDVRPGEYVLTASNEGFETLELRFLVKPREIKAVAVALDLRGLDVSVEVAAELTSLPSTHSPSSTVLTQERLESIPILQRASLPQAVVTAAPGMIRGHDDFVHIRGHEVALNPVINGVSFWENPHAVFSASLPPDVIDSANVMTGGFPAEYGNRFGGVIDIVTKSGLRRSNDGSLTVSGGGAGRGAVAGEFGGNRTSVGYYVFGSVFESDRFLSPPDPRAVHDSARGGHGFAQIDVASERAGLFRMVLMGNGTNFQVPKTPLDADLRPLANAEQRTRQQTAILGWTHASSDSAVGASFYQRWSSARLTPATGALTAMAALDRELRTLGAKADITRFAGRHTIKAGIDAVRLRPDESLVYRYEGYRELTHLLGLPHLHVHDDPITFAGREAGGQVSAYAQDSLPIGARMTADIGVRLDHYDLVVSATHVSPRINLAFQVGGDAIVHGSYNHFVVPPPIEGVLSTSAGLTAAIDEIGVALPPLEPTTEDQFEVGTSALAGPLRLAFTGYYRATDNPVHTTVWPDARLYSYASFDRARAYGLEAKAEAPVLARYGVTGYVNYALGRVNFYNPVTGGFVTEAAHLDETSRFLAPMDQTHTLTGGLTYHHPGTGLRLGTMLEYGSGTPIGHGDDHAHGEAEADPGHVAAGTEAARVPGHFTANVSFGLDLLRNRDRRPKLSLQVDIENLADHVYLIAQDSEFSTAQFSIPRLVSATATFRF